MTMPILACTVGGSPNPIVSAIRAASPAHVVFIVTADGVATDGRAQPGSWRQIAGADSIPARTGLAEGAFHSVTVPPDDPDAAAATLGQALRELLARFPDRPLIADYTGGTKSMSAALLATVLSLPGVELQVMAGTRLDLVRVADGTEHPFRIVPDFLVAERQASLLRRAWQNFGYAEAADGFAELHRNLAARTDAPAELLSRLGDLARLSQGFALWDRFDHAGARAAFGGLAAGLDNWLAPWRARLDVLLSDAATPHLLLDLWLNALRRAERGQYDDAVARCYRLIEWTGQWLLKSRRGIDTGAVAWERISKEELEAAGICRRAGQKELGGLMPTLKLLAVKEPGGTVAAFFQAPVRGEKKKRGINKLKDRLDGRNHSILAHGTKPLSEQDWRKFLDFMQGLFFPSVLHPELALADVETDPLQLPKEPPAFL